MKDLWNQLNKQVASSSDKPFPWCHNKPSNCTWLLKPSSDNLLQGTPPSCSISPTGHRGAAPLGWGYIHTFHQSKLSWQVCPQGVRCLPPEAPGNPEKSGKWQGWWSWAIWWLFQTCRHYYLMYTKYQYYWRFYPIPETSLGISEGTFDTLIIEYIKLCNWFINFGK